MAYQNVGTPRFYINDIDYAKSIGIDVENDLPSVIISAYDGMTEENYYNIIGNNPSTISPIQMIKRTAEAKFRTLDRLPTTKTYFAVLNHNLSSKKVYLRHSYIKDDNSWNDGHSIGEDWVNTNSGSINWNDGTHGTFIRPEYDGWSICEIDIEAKDGNHKNHSFKFYLEDGDYEDDNFPQFHVGCIFMGTYYDMPHSPELDVTMTIKNDGFDSITTQGGAHLNNIRYNGAPMWERADGSEIPPWTIGEPTAVGRRRGRRVWSMNFKYLSQEDLFASNYMSNNYTESSSGYDSADLDTDGDNNEVFYYNLDNDDSFHAQVLNKIGNGHRFIFQPDNTNNNPDQFAICQLDQKSLEINQVANGIYDISLKIREVW